MRCKHYEKWIYLYREGELTLRQRDALNRHLKTCERCREQRDSLDGLVEATGWLKTQKADLSEAERLADTIVNRVRPAPRRFSGSSVRRSHTGIRWALTGAVVIAAAAFFMQQSWIYLKVSKLENRMARMESEPQSHARTPSAMRLQDLMEMPELTGILPSGMEGELMEDDYILIKRETLKGLLQSNRLLEKDRQALLSVIKSIPEFKQIRLVDGLNMTEWQIVARYQQSIVDQVRRYHEQRRQL